MTPERWQKLKALFGGALDLPPGEREAWLTGAAEGDSGLVAEALELLRAHAAEGGPLDREMTSGDISGEVLPPGTQVGPFRIEHELGRGGMGIVYKAFDERLQRPVALKALVGAAATDVVRRRRLQNEALLAATISHPGVATVYRLDQIDGSLYLATEYIAGHTLGAEIGHGPLGLQRALTFTRDILRALQAAHEAGVIHRDLKPDNVMVGIDDAVKIVDFGIARSERFAMTKVTQGGAPGTPAYMAPEQLAGAEADARADLYAVAVMLAEMVSGRHPGTPDVPPLPSQLQAIVDRGLAREPSARFQSAADMLRAIEALQTQDSHGDGVALGWWRFHQCAAAIVYWLMTVPAWSARTAIGSPFGRLLFLAMLAATVVSSILRLHQCFTSYYYANQLAGVRKQVSMSIRASDGAFVLALAGSAFMLGDGQAALMVLLLSVSVGAAVAAFFIEPATARAAFGR